MKLRSITLSVTHLEKVFMSFILTIGIVTVVFVDGRHVTANISIASPGY